MRAGEEEAEEAGKKKPRHQPDQGCHGPDGAGLLGAQVPLPDGVHCLPGGFELGGCLVGEGGEARQQSRALHRSVRQTDSVV